MKTYKYIDDKGTFKLDSAHLNSYLYFPLTNDEGLMSAITPNLHGDIKKDQNTFILPPTSVEDLHNSNASRNFWFNIEGNGPWSATGMSAKQKVSKYNNEEICEVTAGFLWHKVVRNNKELGIKATITTFVPSNKDTVELTKVTIENTGSDVIKGIPTVAVPLYCRSADDIRDHRHVTSLLNRSIIKTNGIFVKPTLSFDERGHSINKTSYVAYVTGEKDNSINNYYPTLEEFIGEGGSLDWPEKVVKPIETDYKVNDEIDGYEAMAAMSFNQVSIQVGEQLSFYMLIGTDKNGGNMEELVDKYLNKEGFEKALLENENHWNNKLNALSFNFKDKDYNNWLKWVTLQPILRRIYGCSYLPHHDYGRGGRGWRDLWQDCLALILMESDQVENLLWNNFGGVRIDGSNATIIGSGVGEFIADRNKIARVWMDHGAWPFLTTKLYIDRSGDIEFLLKKQTYFKDTLISRGADRDTLHNEDMGNKLLNQNDKVYEGTILEHILVQHLTPFYNVGEHNNIKLEGADWNDAFDMARDKGESVAFTAFYAYNLEQLALLIKEMSVRLGCNDVQLAKEINILLDHVNYDDMNLKSEVLNGYYESCKHNVTGEKIKVDIEKLINNLLKKANDIKQHINKNEWIETTDGLGWYNGYYDNDGQKVEGEFDSDIRMTLTGQVFNVMGNISDEKRTKKIVDSVNKVLYDHKVGGYRLNSNFQEVKLNLGRGFGFAFGHKENGAMFSHMAVMYSNALYSRGLKEDGDKVISSIYNHCVEFEKSRIYPGIPEYINERGRGMYNYLTGSASWLLLTMVEEVCGVKGHLGDLLLEPKLLDKHFDEEGICSITTVFADKLVTIKYHKGETIQTIKEILVGNDKIPYSKINEKVIITRDNYLKYTSNLNVIDVYFD